MQDHDHIDAEGFRANVGIIISDAAGAVLIGGRIGQQGWQFPQGGIRRTEETEAAMYRELCEEVGLTRADVELLGCTRDWLHYHLPEQYIRRNVQPLCIGQKQRWFLLRLKTGDSALKLDTTATPEFDRWRWVEFWEPVREVIFFKRHVYIRALRELGALLYPAGLPPRPGWWRPEWEGCGD